MTYTIGTFNTENLFLRLRLLDQPGSREVKGTNWETLANALEQLKAHPLPRRDEVSPEEYQRVLARRAEILSQVGFTINDLSGSITDYGPVSQRARQLTARVILEHAPDVVALQEVESLAALEDFNRSYLDRRYPYRLVIDGNDPRNIDVGLLSRYPLGGIRTHRFARFRRDVSPKTGRIFSRDCLEVEVLLPEGPLSVFVNHFKSKLPDQGGGHGEWKRELQAREVARILHERFGDDPDAHFAVLGDLNCGPAAPELGALMALGLDNVLNDLPEAERWTHDYRGHAEQLDYVLLSPALARRKVAGSARVERRGLPRTIRRYTGDRFDATVGGADGASDHCALYVDIDL